MTALLPKYNSLTIPMIAGPGPGLRARSAGDNDGHILSWDRHMGGLPASWLVLSASGITVHRRPRFTKLDILVPKVNVTIV